MKSWNIRLKLGLALLVILLVLIFLGSYLSPYNPLLANPTERYLPATCLHWMGTDNFGRDIFTRILYGGRITLPASFLALTLTTALGISLGCVAAFHYQGSLDRILMRMVDLLLAFPFIVIAMSLSVFFGRGFKQLLWMIVGTWWAGTARLTRSLVLPLLEEPYVQVAKICGASPWRIACKEILPNIFDSLFIQFTFDYSNVILSLSTLSFFGLGSQPPTAEWGSMLADGRQYLSTAPQLLVWPSLAVFLIVLTFNLIGEGLRQQHASHEIPQRWEVG